MRRGRRSDAGSLIPAFFCAHLDLPRRVKIADVRNLRGLGIFGLVFSNIVRALGCANHMLPCLALALQAAPLAWRLCPLSGAATCTEAARLFPRFL